MPTALCAAFEQVVERFREIGVVEIRRIRDVEVRCRMASDWRLQGQDAYLRGVELQWKRYRSHSQTWEHDHCSFCWTKFVDPESSTAHRELAKREDTLSEGYTTTSKYERGAGSHWVCARCFSDFAAAFEWSVVSQARACRSSAAPEKPPSVD